MLLLPFGPLSSLYLVLLKKAVAGLIGRERQGKKRGPFLTETKKRMLQRLALFSSIQTGIIFRTFIYHGETNFGAVGLLASHQAADLKRDAVIHTH